VARDQLSAQPRRAHLESTTKVDCRSAPVSAATTCHHPKALDRCSGSQIARTLLRPRHWSAKGKRGMVD